MKIDPNDVVALTLVEVLEEFGHLVGEVNVANGWDTSRGMIARPDDYDAKWHVAHKIAELGLVTTEVSEAIEEVRKGRAMTETYYENDNVDIVKATKPQGVPSELADAMIRILDISNAYGIDLGAAVIEKLNHNATRGLHHGGKAL